MGGVTRGAEGKVGTMERKGGEGCEGERGGEMVHFGGVGSEAG